MDSGQKRLQELGYKQELRRNLSAVSNFAFSFAIISILAGVTTLFNTGLTYGGTTSFTWGWLLSGSFTLFLAFSMAEICSAFPTSGGLYFWSAQLAGHKWKPLASWITGWYNVVGQWAATCSLNYSLALLVQVMVLLSTRGANGGGYVLNKYQLIGIHGGIIVTEGLLNCMPIQYVDYLGLLSIPWNILGVLLLIIIIPAVAKERQTASFVFTSFNLPTDLNLPSEPYVFLLGLLMSQYGLAGFDASAHMEIVAKIGLEAEMKGRLSNFGMQTEETKSAEPRIG